MRPLGVIVGREYEFSSECIVSMLSIRSFVAHPDVHYLVN